MRTESLLQGVPYFHSFSVDRRSVLTDEHLGDFQRGPGGAVVIDHPAHCHVYVRWLGLVSVVGWYRSLGGVVSCVPGTKGRRADVDDESSNFV